MGGGRGGGEGGGNTAQQMAHGEGLQAGVAATRRTIQSLISLTGERDARRDVEAQ